MRAKLIELRHNHQVTSSLGGASRSCAQNNRSATSIASRLSSPWLIDFKAGPANRFEDFAFSYPASLARFVQETDRSVSSAPGRK
jgi:hypothetical protein